MTACANTPVTANLDPFTPTTERSYVDDRVRVVHVDHALPARPTSADAVRTAHFLVGISGRRVELTHWMRPHQLDNDLAGLLVAELFEPGWLSGNDTFERIFLGIVRSTVRDPLLAWNTFYANTLAKVRECWADADHVQPGSEIANMAPIYDRALRLVPPGRVLDLGSCFGFLPLLLAERSENHVIASDLSAGSMRLLSAVSHARGSSVRTMVCAASSVPLPSGSVDTVTIIHLLEHLSPAHGKAVLNEAVRLARNWVVVAVPFEDEPASVYGHVRRFNLATLEQLAIATGRPYTVSEFHGGWLVIDAG